jgi:S-adenosylmethionine decarboxylase
LDALGTQLILELKQCNANTLNDLPFVRESLREAAQIIGATIIGESFHQFDPIGVTGVIAIAESHLCIHTWPEHSYAAVDIFTCGDTSSLSTASQLLIDKFEAMDFVRTEVLRGLISELATASNL